MAFTIQLIKSAGMEQALEAYTRQHWEEHTPATMHSMFDIDFEVIQALEAIDKLRGYVVMDESVTIGYMVIVRGPHLFSKSTHEWTIQCVYTHPAARRGGAFAKMMSLAEEEALNDGAAVLNMEAPANFKAGGWMESNGFVSVEQTYRKIL